MFMSSGAVKFQSIIIPEGCDISAMFDNVEEIYGDVVINDPAIYSTVVSPNISTVAITLDISRSDTLIEVVFLATRHRAIYI